MKNLITPMIDAPKDLVDPWVAVTCAWLMRILIRVLRQKGEL